MKGLVYIFFFLSLFPFLDFFQLGTDTQPNAIIFASIILFAVRNKKVNLPIILMYVQVLFALSLYFMNSLGSLVFVKQFFNYLSPPLLASAVYTIYSQLNIKLPFKLFIFTTIAYAGVGLVQLYWQPEFMGFLLNANRGTLIGGRGVLSLCPEPSFYGSICLLFMVFSLLAYNKKQNYIAIPIILFQLVFLSRSSTGIAVLLFAGLLFTVIQLIRFRLKYLFLAILILSIAIPIGNQQLKKFEDTRIGEITMSFIENPLNITKVDGSIGVRFASSVAPFLNIRYDYFKPKGIGRYQPFLRKLYNSGECRSFLTIPIIADKDRMEGSINVVLFQLGILGIFLPIAIFLGFRPILKSSVGLFCFLIFFTLLFTQIRLTLSMVGFIIGYAIYLGNLTRNSSLPA